MSCSTGVEKFWCHYSLTLHTGFDLLGNINQVVELGPYNFGHSTQQLIHDNLFSGLSGDLLIKSQIFQLLGKLENYWEKVIDSYYKPIHQYQ